VWRKFNFSAITTSKIRVLANASADGWSRVAEVEAWGTNAGSGSSVAINWLVADQLGTPRMVVDKTGALGNVKRHDYLPFGEELFASQGTRTTTLGYSGDAIRQKFTSKERDSETGLDYFGARYYAYTQGRFIGVDMAGPDFLNPQTLNKYQYCVNNPLRHIDRNGLYEEDVHRDLTYALALAAGFKTASAWQIADANQWTDDSPDMGPMGLPWGKGMKRRELWHFTTQSRRNDLWDAFNFHGTLLDLGIFLHAQQDSFSHEGYGPRWGHAKDGHDPDLTFKRPGRANIMALDTFNRLKEALSIRIGKGKENQYYDAMAWRTIMPLVDDFNRAKSPAEKQRIINQIVQFVQDEHRRQEMERIKKKNIQDTLRGQRGK
jgi:RHS repeat-associated protein